MKESLLAARSALIAARSTLASKKATIGFDGFLDEILKVVDQRQDKDTFTAIPTIEALGKRVLTAAGKSANIELVPETIKLGGNGPLMASGLGSLGPSIFCIGLMGKPLHPVFAELSQQLPNIELFTIGDPGYTQALEFQDGKLMLGKPGTMRQMNWQNLSASLGSSLDEKLFAADLLACTNWTQLTEMTPLLVELEKRLPENSGVTFFFDLADPEKRPVADLREVLALMGRIEKKARVILGVNLREAEQVAAAIGYKDVIENTIEGGMKATPRIREMLGIHGFVIHMVAYAAGAVGNEVAGVPGPFCARPKLTTGAGDHFNGGFCAGRLAGLTLEQSLYVGVCTSGAYVRIARSPSFDELAGFMDDWAQGRTDAGTPG